MKNQTCVDCQKSKPENQGDLYFDYSPTKGRSSNEKFRCFDCRYKEVVEHQTMRYRKYGREAVWKTLEAEKSQKRPKLEYWDKRKADNISALEEVLKTEGLKDATSDLNKKFSKAFFEINKLVK